MRALLGETQPGGEGEEEEEEGGSCVVSAPEPSRMPSSATAAMLHEVVQVRGW